MILNYNLIVSFIFFFLAPFSNAGADVVDEVSALLKAANTKELADYFDSSVEISIQGEEEVYSRSEAEAKMHAFLSKNPPVSIQIVHRLTSNPRFRFGVMTLRTANGNFRVSVSLKNTSGRFLITEMRIEGSRPE